MFISRRDFFEHLHQCDSMYIDGVHIKLLHYMHRFYVYDGDYELLFKCSKESGEPFWRVTIEQPGYDNIKKIISESRRERRRLEMEFKELRKQIELYNLKKKKGK